jgi:hypothetical protein
LTSQVIYRLPSELPWMIVPRHDGLGSALPWFFSGNFIDIEMVSIESFTFFWKTLN